ncbi:MAG TPA: BTAD domain-containing putative transcriptional regulator [Longimicrobiales bacterium]|nr:BTAD domain-containing putative transcriptional regulator [Longimicrobiales bacterium]
MSLRISTLGRIRIVVDDQEVDWLTTHRRRAALMLYLALERTAARERILGLLWPEAPDDKARNSLNQLIYSVRKSLGDDVVITNGDRVELGSDVHVDAYDFIEAAERGDYSKALELYCGGFLQDLNLADAPAFEHWAEHYRARITRLHRKARRSELDRLQATDVTAALELAHQWVHVEPEDDEAQHAYIKLLIQAGQRSAAMNHYAAYEQVLVADGLTPLDETKELIAQLRSTPPSESKRLRAYTGLRPIAEHEEEVHMPWLGRLVADLKRRHVLRVMTIYGLCCWGAIEITDSAFTQQWIPRALLIAAVIGAPVVLVCAWVFDITPRGVKRTQR